METSKNKFEMLPSPTFKTIMYGSDDLRVSIDDGFLYFSLFDSVSATPELTSGGFLYLFGFVKYSSEFNKKIPEFESIMPGLTVQVFPSTQSLVVPSLK